MKLYKALGKNGEAVNGGNGVWNRHGKWMPFIEGVLVPCENGYHLCRREDLLLWIGPTIWEAEYRGQLIERSDKVVVRKARITKKLSWDETTARLFAVDCVEHIMHLGDEVRLSAILATVYLFAIGEVFQDELDAAREYAREGAWDSARVATQTAARVATQAAAQAAAQAARDAARAAREAVYQAAWDAAWEGAREAEATERKWQMDRLFEYLETGNDTDLRLASEGYNGGYRDALDDVMLLLNDVRPTRHDFWDD